MVPALTTLDIILCKVNKVTTMIYMLLKDLPKSFAMSFYLAINLSFPSPKFSTVWYDVSIIVVVTNEPQRLTSDCSEVNLLEVAIAMLL